MLEVVVGLAKAMGRIAVSGLVYVVGGEFDNFPDGHVLFGHYWIAFLRSSAFGCV